MNSFDFQVQALINLIGGDCVLQGLEIISPKGIQRPSDEAIATEAARLETEHNWGELRAKRNHLLGETDYFANSDVTMSDAMRTYRQALRDLPANTTDPVNPVWPTEPSA